MNSGVNHGAQGATAEVRAELSAALADWGVEGRLLLDDRSSLIRSGALDSVALFNLSVWIEERLGRPVDPTSFDVLEAWDSVEAILHFLVVSKRQTPAGPVDVLAEPATLASRSPTQDAARIELAPSPDVVPPAAGSDYELVRYAPEFKGAVGRLMTALWSRDPSLNERVFAWKYETNPFASEPLIYIALHRGRPIGMRALCETLWQAEGLAQPVSLYCADDLVVEQTHRNRGLFAAFTRRVVQDLADGKQHHFISLSALRVTRLQSLAHGAKSVPMATPLGLKSGWATLADRVAEDALRLPVLWRIGDSVPAGKSAHESFRRLDAAASASIFGTLIELATEADPESMAALVTRLGHDGRIRHVRDARFFAWRYQAPHHVYRFLSARRGGTPGTQGAGELAGYMVLQRALSPLANQRRTNIVDWAAGDQETLSALLQFAIRNGRFSELVTWSDLAGSPYAAALMEHGFQATDMHQVIRGLPCILIHSVDGASSFRLGSKSMLEPAAWDLKMAYTSYA